jgi:hypothetical protein
MEPREVEMRRSMCRVFGLTALLWSLFALVGTKEVLAGVNLNINIGPPPVVVAAPPEVVAIPGTQVYFVPQPGIDIFFFGGYWWSPRGDRWYRAVAYNGPWTVIKRRYVPGPVIGVPRDYRERFARERHIPYGQWKKEGRREPRKEHRERREEREGHEHER